MRGRKVHENVTRKLYMLSTCDAFYKNSMIIRLAASIMLSNC